MICWGFGLGLVQGEGFDLAGKLNMKFARPPLRGLGRPQPDLAVSFETLIASTKENTPTDSRCIFFWCRERVSNPRRHKPPDLQSGTIDHSVIPAGISGDTHSGFLHAQGKWNTFALALFPGGIPGYENLLLMWSRQRDSNPRPAVYKTAALATELCRHSVSYPEILPKQGLNDNLVY